MQKPIGRYLVVKLAKDNWAIVYADKPDYVVEYGFAHHYGARAAAKRRARDKAKPLYSH